MGSNISHCAIQYKEYTVVWGGHPDGLLGRGAFA